MRSKAGKHGGSDDISIGGQSFNTANSTMSAKEVRQSVREYIRNERDTVLIKWRTLGESVKSEDRTRDQFLVRRSREDAKNLPVNIQKFIGTLKRAVRKTMREKGGTPFSIVRALFMYWTSSTDGTLTPNDLKNVMNSLGVKMSDAERAEVVEYYSATTHKKVQSTTTAGSSDAANSASEPTMSYDELLQDITRGEPTNIQEVGLNYFDSNDVELRYEEVADQYAIKPPVVQEFIDATRNYIMLEMRTQGGTPYYHVRYLFQFFDHDLSNGLDAKELQNAARKKMKLAMTQTQAEQIVRFYDRKGEGQMHYDIFLKDVTEGELSRPLLSFKELTLQEREEAQSKLSKNVFMPRPFKPAATRVLEEFKVSLKKSLTKKIGATGGRFESWILGAFREYDKSLTNRVGSWEVVRDIAHKLGVTIGKSTALTLICSYDKNFSGEMHYLDFIKDMDAEDPHFLAHTGPQIRLKDTVPGQTSPSAPPPPPPPLPHPPAATSFFAAAPAAHSSVLSLLASPLTADSPTARCPPEILKIIARFSKAANIYAQKSGQAISARDLVYGTCLRFDTQRVGHLTTDQVQQVADELRVPTAGDDVRLIVGWFDSKGTGRLLDYKALCRQMFGSDDALSRALTLPKLSKKAGSALYKATLTYEMNPAADFADEDATSMTSAAQGPSGAYSVTMRGSTIDKSVSEVIESVKDKSRRLEAKRGMVLREREDIEVKLLAVEASKKKLLQDLSARRAKEAAAKHKDVSAAVLQNMAAAAAARKEQREAAKGK